MSDIKLWQGDCLELMKDIPDKSVDMIFTDLPYGTTNCRWDSIIPLEDYVMINGKNDIIEIQKRNKMFYFLYFILIIWRTCVILYVILIKLI